MDWIGAPETLDSETHFGFVYLITNLSTGKKYIGKKQFFSKLKKPPLKGKTRKRTVVKESDWKSYYGSSEDLKNDVATYGKENFQREILHLTTCKWESAYVELQEQLDRKALFRDDYYNGIINIRLNAPPKSLKDKYKA